jgi:hypothetical protein
LTWIFRQFLSLVCCVLEGFAIYGYTVVDERLVREPCCNQVVGGGYGVVVELVVVAAAAAVVVEEDISVVVDEMPWIET